MEKNKNRLEITEYIMDVSNCLDGDVKMVIAYLNGLLEKYNRYNRLFINGEADCYECDGVNLSLFGLRKETDNEYDARMKRIKRAEITCKKKAKSDKLKREEREKKLLNKLLEKYGKDKSI